MVLKELPGGFIVSQEKLALRASCFPLSNGSAAMGRFPEREWAPLHRGGLVGRQPAFSFPVATEFK